MAEINVDAKRLAAVFRATETKRVATVRKAVFEAATLGAEVVAAKVPVDMGALKSSIRAVRTFGGAEILADAPHAGIIESGARPHMPPLQPIIEWVRRHLGAFGLKKVSAPGIGAAASARAQRGRDRQAARHAESEKQIEGIAWGIARKIARDGSAPHWFMRGSLPQLRDILHEVLERRLGK